MFVSRSHLESGPLGPLAVIDFADLNSPVVTYYEPSSNPFSTDVEASSQYLWLAYESCAGTPLFRWPLGDLTQPPLALNPSDFGQCEAQTGCANPAIDSCHTITVAAVPGGPELLLCSGTSNARALHILDITQDPPVHVACWQPPVAMLGDPPCTSTSSEGVHESFLWQDPQGRLLVATATQSQGLSILQLNLGPPGSLTRVFHACYDGHFVDQSPASNPLNTFTHSAWVSDDARYLFTSDELPGAWVLAWDLDNLGACTVGTPEICGNDPTMCNCARQVGQFRKPGSAAYQSVPHNLFAQGDLLYVAHYSEGVRVLDITDPTALETSEIAFFDTFLGPTCPERPTCAALGGAAEDGTWGLSPRGPFLVVAEQQSGVYFLEQFPSHFPAPVAFQPVDALAATAIAAADFDGEGTLDVAVIAADDVFALDFALFLNNGDSSFRFDPSVPGCSTPGPGPTSVARNLVAGDFNNDGLGDLAFGFQQNPAFCSPCSYYVRILLGNGTGGFTCGAVVTLPPACGDPGALAVGRLNGPADSSLDLAVASCGVVQAFLGDGLGGMTPGWSESTAGPIHDVAIGDYDGDGFADLGYANSSFNSVTVKKNDGAAGFTQACRSFTGGSPHLLSDPRSLAFGPLDGDAKTDLVIANRASSTATAVRSAGCTSTGELVAVPALGFAPGDIAIGQFNYQDQLGDIAVAGSSVNRTAILKQDAACSPASLCFLPAAEFQGGRRLVAADFNRDNKDDIVTHDRALVYLHGLGDGSLRDAIPTPVAGATVRATGDFNGDGKADVVVFDGSTSPVKVLLGDGTGKFTTPGNTDCNSAADIPNPSDVVVADFNADGFRDLAVCDAGTNEIVICLGTVAGGFTPLAGFASGVTFTNSIAVGVVRSTSTNVDLVAVGTNSNSVAVHFGNGNGTFAAPPIIYAGIGSFPVDLAIGNLDNGSALDIAVAARDSKEVWVLLNDTNGGFPTRTGYSTVPATPLSIDLGDFGNGTIPVDFFADALTGNAEGTVSLLYNNGLGGLSLPTHITVDEPLPESPGPTDVRALDLDSDGRPEIVAANSTNLAVVARDAAGLLETSAFRFRSSTGGFLATADFDGDFSPDVATGAVEVLQNRGGYWPVRQCLPSPGEPIAVEALDFRGNDGHIDLVTANRASKKLHQYQGNGDATFQFQSSVDLPAVVPPTVRELVAMDVARSPSGALLVVADAGAKELLVSTSTGAGFPLPTVIALSTFTPKLVAIANFDEDDSVLGNDVAVVGTDTALGPQLRIYWNVDTPTPLMDSFSLSAFNHVEGLAVGRLNADAYTDIVISADQDVTPDSIQVWLRVPPNLPPFPQRQFSGPVASTIEPTFVGVRARGVIVADFNGDTLPEVVVANEGTPSDVRVMRRTDDVGNHVLAEQPLVSPGAFALAVGSINGTFPTTAPNDLWVVHRDQVAHPATALVTGLLSPNNTMLYLTNAGLALGSFDGPAVATGDFTTLPGLTTPADGLAIVNRGRHDLCVVQFQ